MSHEPLEFHGADLERAGRLEVGLEGRHLRRVAGNARISRERATNLRADDPRTDTPHELRLVQSLHGGLGEGRLFGGRPGIRAAATTQEAGLVVRPLRGVGLTLFRVLADQDLIVLDGLDLVHDDGREQARHGERREVAGHCRLLGRRRGRRTGIGCRSRCRGLFLLLFFEEGDGRLLFPTEALDTEPILRLLGQHGDGEQGQDEAEEGRDTLHG